MRLPRWSLAVLAVASCVGVVLRAGSASPLWLDEALSVEIARLPVDELLDALRRDGAPPLYYLLLHGWMKLFGTSDIAVRSLSAVFSIATIPMLFVAARRRGGDTVAISAAVLLATSPYAIRYATEARMYSLVALLAIAGWLAVVGALASPRGVRLVAVAVVSGLLLLTHYWSFYLLAAVAIAGLLAWRWRPMLRPALVRVGLAMVAGSVALFAPWMPTFLFQLARTGTPWGTSPGPVEVAFTTLVDFGGGPYPEGQTIAALLAGLAILGLAGRGIDERRIELDLRTVPGVRTELMVAAGTMLAGVGVGMVTSSAWASRYNSVVFPLVLLAAAMGVRAIEWRQLLAGLLVVAAALGVVGGIRNAVTPRTQAGETATTIVDAGAQSGDMVVYCPDQLGPDAQRELPDRLELRHVTFPDFGSPKSVDWVDYEQRVQAADPVAFANEVLRRAGEHRIFYVWMSGYRTHGTLCETINNTLAGGSRQSTELQRPHPDLFERHIVWLHEPARSEPR